MTTKKSAPKSRPAIRSLLTTIEAMRQELRAVANERNDGCERIAKLHKELSEERARTQALSRDLVTVLEKSAMAWSAVVEGVTDDAEGSPRVHLRTAKRCVEDAFEGVSKETRDALGLDLSMRRMQGLIANHVLGALPLYALFARLVAK